MGSRTQGQVANTHIVNVALIGLSQFLVDTVYLS